MPPEPETVEEAPIVNVALSKLAERLMEPVLALILPEAVMELLFVTLTLPPPVSEMPVMVSKVAASLKLTLPLVVLVALKLAMTLVPFNV